MKLILVTLLVTCLAAVVVAKPAKNMPCDKECPYDYEPVCAGAGTEKPKSFGNKCVMEKYNCEHKSQLVVKSQGECPGGGGVRLQ